MSCRDKAIRTTRNLQTLAIRVERFLILAGQVVSKSEVIPDIKLQCAGRNVSRVRLAVGFDFVRLTFDQLRSLLQIGDRQIKLPQSDLTVTAMSIETASFGKRAMPFV